MRVLVNAKMAKDSHGNYYIVKEESTYAEIDPDALAAYFMPHFRAWLEKEGLSVDKK